MKSAQALFDIINSLDDDSLEHAFIYCGEQIVGMDRESLLHARIGALLRDHMEDRHVYRLRQTQSSRMATWSPPHIDRTNGEFAMQIRSGDIIVVWTLNENHEPVVQGFKTLTGEEYVPDSPDWMRCIVNRAHAAIAAGEHLR